MIATPKPWVWASLMVAVVLVTAPRAHESDTPHQLVLASFAVEQDSLRVVLWVERPTPIVARAFRERFADDRTAAAAQDEAFREEQWAHMAESVAVRVNGTPLETTLRPLPMPNNGRGNAVRFVYGVGVRVGVDGVDRVEVEYDNQALLDEPHVFLSVYADTDDAWRVVEDSSRAITGERLGANAPAPEATWSHDPRLRQGRIVFARE